MGVASYHLLPMFASSVSYLLPMRASSVIHLLPMRASSVIHLLLMQGAHIQATQKPCASLIYLNHSPC